MVPHSRSRGPLPPSTAGSTEAPVLRSLVRLQGHLTSPPVTLLVSRTCPHIQPLPSAHPPESRVRVAACSWVLPPQPPHDRGTPPPPPPRVGPVPRCMLAGRAPAARGHGTANTRGRHQGTLLPAARPVPGIAVDPVAGCGKGGGRDVFAEKTDVAGRAGFPGSQVWSRPHRRSQKLLPQRHLPAVPMRGPGPAPRRQVRVPPSGLL